MAVLVIGCMGPYVAAADAGVMDVIAMRNHNPFLQIFGLPMFQSATLAERGRLKYDLSAELTNHADAGANDTERLILDGETYSFNLSLRHRMARRLEVGIDVPFVSHQEGFLDNIIKEWHSFLGVSNSNRSGPTNELNFLYESNGTSLYQLDSSASGIGDVQLTLAIPFREASEEDPGALTLRSSVKLATGDEKKLLGSGATDYSLALHASTKTVLFDRPLGLSGFAGVLFMGDGDVLPDLQRSSVSFGGIAAKLQVTERFGIVTQVYAQGDYYDSDLKEIGDGTFQLGIGLDYHLPTKGMSLALGIAEDPLSDATPDFAIQFSVRSDGRRSGT